MAWRAARYEHLHGLTFLIKCPYCGEQYVWNRAVEKAYPDPQICAECEQTYIIPVTVSRGAISES